MKTKLLNKYHVYKAEGVYYVRCFQTCDGHSSIDSLNCCNIHKSFCAREVIKPKFRFIFAFILKEGYVLLGYEKNCDTVSH